jgi:hypothetical protein
MRPLQRKPSDPGSGHPRIRATNPGKDQPGQVCTNWVYSSIRVTFVDGYRTCLDYNPNSSLLAMGKIRQLLLASRFKVFHTGFGKWWENVSQDFYCSDLPHEMITV